MTEKAQAMEQNTELNAAQKIHEKLGLTRTFPLVESIASPLGEITSVTARRVKVVDYKRAAEMYPENGALQQIHVLTVASGLQAEDFDQMAWEDYQKLRQFCTGS